MISIIVLLPLISAIITGLFSNRVGPKQAMLFSSGLMIVTALLSYVEFYNVVILKQPYTQVLFTWLDIESLKANWALKVDPLTAIMLIVVNTVSCLVHVYSVGYMSHDPNRKRFFAYLSLFTFFMLMLVTADNLLQMFLGWEGVGLCSYLLIGFWYSKDTANAASMKAFIVNRVGDLGFALGIFTIFICTGSIEFETIFSEANTIKELNFKFLGYDIHALTLICILLFIGAMGKSAQLGLHVWLPDAMEGPTPVSALIHAATMVTAGVFMVARLSPLFELSPIALQIITYVGAFTAIFAATIAITQNDIKKVIAYSTCSQLGYMFFACGVSAYSAGVFHLTTHAFFKALLFLGAGSVIHAMTNEQDLRKMGGIWKKIPFTYAMFWIGNLAIIGFPPFSGYYSKDMILESAYAAHSTHGMLAFWLGIIAAFCTAFYSWRLLIMAFHGKPRAEQNVIDHVHESPKVMTIPLLILAIGAVIAGYILYKLGIVDSDLAFWNNSIVALPENNPLEHAHHVPFWVKKAPLIAGILGLSLAYMIYMFNLFSAKKISSTLKPLYNLSFHKYYIDQIYHLVFVMPLRRAGTFLSKIVDTKIIDGIPNGFAFISGRAGVLLSKFQSGYVYHYALVFVLAIAVLLGFVITRF